MSGHLHVVAAVVALLCTGPAVAGGSSGAGAAGHIPAMPSTLNDSFSYTANGTCTGGPVSVPFHASVTGGAPPYNYTWDFGDGSPPGFGADPTHTYANPMAGPFNATLSIVDATGSRASDTQRILFLYPPCATRSNQGPLPASDISVLVAGALVLVALLMVWRRRGLRR